jgi:hypothetical protein
MSQLNSAISTVLVFKGLIRQWTDRMHFILNLRINFKNGIEEATKQRIQRSCALILQYTKQLQKQGCYSSNLLVQRSRV